MSDTEDAKPAIAARAITQRGARGPVFGPLDLDVDIGGVTVLVCPPGSGRTALLLTLAGRMSPVSGTLTVFGHTRPRDIFAHAALAAVENLDGIADSVTVGDVVTEQLRWEAPWYRQIRRADDAAVARLCVPIFGDLPLPARSAYVEELAELDRMLLHIALANIARPPLLVVGDIDQVSDDSARDLLVERLVRLGDEQTVITASANDLANHPVCQIAVENATRPASAGQQKGGA